jgi:peptidoglycan-associated lipoprotein
VHSRGSIPTTISMPLRDARASCFPLAQNFFLRTGAASCVLQGQGGLLMTRLTILALVLAAGCGGSVKANAKLDVDLGLNAKAKVKVKAAPEEVVTASPNIGVTNNIAEECMLQLRDTAKTPKFDYDQFGLEVEDRTVLESIATCLTTGPLQGRAIQLVGRADPRGTQEYNLALGNKRASTVAAYFKKIGIGGDQISTTTRGDLDAEGTAEQTWRDDRRVDIVLMEDLTTVSSR